MYISLYKKRLPSIVHDIQKSAQAPKCLIVKSLKTKIVHTVCNQGIVQDVHVREKKSCKDQKQQQPIQQSKCAMLLLIKPIRQIQLSPKCIGT